METQEQGIIRNLKLLLMHLAAKSESPEQVLQELLRQVISELRDEVQDRIHELEGGAARLQPHLRLVRSETVSDMTAG